MTEVLEGEVIETGRDVEVRVAALRDLPVENQIHAVTVMLSDARTRLLAATAVHDLPGICDLKAKAATLQEISKQLRLGNDMQLDAAEFVRHAERSLGLGIRDGQAAGTIIKPGDIGGGGRHGQTAYESRTLERKDLDRPTDFATEHELHGKSGIYAMTDGVSDAAFAEALAEAREEENLSRANVARKSRTKAEADRFMDLNEKTAPTAEQRKVRKTAGARKVMEDLVISINSLVFIVEDTDPAEVDGQRHKSDIQDVRRGITAIGRFLKKVEEAQ